MVVQSRVRDWSKLPCSAESPTPYVRGNAQKTVIGISYANGINPVTGKKIPIKARATKRLGTALRGVDDVIANPQLLKGQSLNQVKNVLGSSKGWVNDVMRRSNTNPNGGWVLREMNNAGTDFTGRMIQYHPGTPRHFGGNPYWKVSSGSGIIRIPLNP